MPRADRMGERKRIDEAFPELARLLRDLPNALNCRAIFGVFHVSRVAERIALVAQAHPNPPHNYPYYVVVPVTCGGEVLLPLKSRRLHGWRPVARFLRDHTYDRTAIMPTEHGTEAQLHALLRAWHLLESHAPRARLTEAMA